MRKSVFKLLAASSIASFAVAALPAFAQDADTNSDATVTEEDDGALREIVVTATRSGATNLQKTPIAVTALDAEELSDRGVRSLSDLNGLAPNVSIGTRSGAGATSGAVTIRGIGIDANPPASPAVGIYVDEVYQPAAFGNLIGLFDVERIEILRGPQGTSFGRNTISGAIQYVGVKPKLGEVSGYLEGTLGNLDRRDVAGAINLPLGEIAALRVSGAYQDRDGYIRDVLQGVNRGSEINKDVRVQLRVQPSDALTIDLKGEYLKQEGNGRASTAVAFNYATSFGAGYAPAGLNAFISPSFYVNAGLNSPESFNAELKVAQGIIAYDIADGITIKSITAYVESDATLLIDQDGSPASVLNVSRGNQTSKLFTQELLLTGKILDDRLKFTLGAYYYSDNAGSKDSNAFTSARALGIPVPPGVDPETVVIPLGNPFGNYTIKTESYSVFGQATFNITDQLAIVGGLRYTSETGSVTNSSPFVTPSSRKFTNVSPLIGLNFQATDDIMLYAKWSRGFRAGGFAPTAAQTFNFDPETTETYELGARIQMLDGRLRVNPTVFATPKWKNIQFNQIVVDAVFGPLPIINNAGDAKMKGAEIEIQAAVTDHFTITASGALLDSEYTRADPSLVLSGNLTLTSDLKRAPKSQFALGGRYDLTLGSAGDVAISLNYAWQATQRSSTSDRDNYQIPSYGLLNGRIDFDLPGDMFTISLFANNITKKKYLIGGTVYGNGGAIPTTSLDIGRPREYGVTVKASF